MGNLLSSGSGKGNSQISKAWLLGIIDAVTSFVIAALFWLAFEGDTWDYVLIVVILVNGILAIIASFVLSARIKGTYLNIFEDRVSGVFVNRDISLVLIIFFYLGWDKAKHINVDFSFDDIIAVSAQKDSINLHSMGINYKCFVSNGLEITNIINDKIAKRRAS